MSNLGDGLSDIDWSMLTSSFCYVYNGIDAN